VQNWKAWQVRLPRPLVEVDEMRWLYFIPVFNTSTIIALAWPNWFSIPAAILQAIAIVFALQSAWHDGRASAFREAISDLEQRFSFGVDLTKEDLS